MLISKEVEVRWNNANKKWYMGKGYQYTKNNDYFICKTEDLTPASRTRVTVNCDYCGAEITKQYSNYMIERRKVPKDCCSNRKCMVLKSEEVSMITYGVSNYAKTDKHRKRLRELRLTPFEDVLSLCQNKGLILLSKEDDYVTDRSRLIVICTNHKEQGKQETNFANIKANQSCCWFGGNELIAEIQKKDGEDVYDAFTDAGLIPKFQPEDYINNISKLPYMCPLHQEKGIQYRTYSDVKCSVGCPYCSYERTANALRANGDMVFSELISKGLIPIEGEYYKGKDTPIEYRCEKHIDIIQTTTYSSFQRSNQCCECCRKENSISNLSQQIRSSIGAWKSASETACRHQCVITGSKVYHVHHLYSFNSIIKDAMEYLSIETKEEYSGEEIVKIKDKVVELHKVHPLGVCLREDIHILMHQIYSKNVTSDMFDEFTVRYKSGEFDYLQNKEERVV